MTHNNDNLCNACQHIDTLYHNSQYNITQHYSFILTFSRTYFTVMQGVIMLRVFMLIVVAPKLGGCIESDDSKDTLTG
jgi:hypothetical protein